MTNIKQYARTIAAAAKTKAEALDTDLIEVWASMYDHTNLDADQLADLADQLWLLHGQLTLIQGELNTLNEIL